MNELLKKFYLLKYVAVFLIAVIFFKFDFYPKLKEADQLKGRLGISKKASQTITERQKEKETKVLQEDVRRVKAALDALPAGVREIQGKIKEEQNIPLLTMAVEDLASVSKIKLISVKPLPIKEKDGYDRLPIEIKFQCTYPELIRFLRYAEKSPEIVAVQEMTVERDDLIYPKLDIRLVLYALFKSPQKEGSVQSQEALGAQE